MKTSFLLVLAISMCVSCTSENLKNKDYPDCLQERIDFVLNAPPANPRATIEKYRYQDEIVYVFTTFMPDFPMVVYNKNCEPICEMGGIASPETDTCINWEDAEYIETVWVDDR